MLRRLHQFSLSGPLEGVGGTVYCTTTWQLASLKPDVSQVHSEDKLIPAGDGSGDGIYKLHSEDKLIPAGEMGGGMGSASCIARMNSF